MSQIIDLRPYLTEQLSKLLKPNYSASIDKYEVYEDHGLNSPHVFNYIHISSTFDSAFLQCTVDDNHKLHSYNGYPAVIFEKTYHPTFNVPTQRMYIWFKHGLVYREDDKCTVLKNGISSYLTDSGFNIYKWLNINKETHREQDKPAVITTYDNLKIFYCEWYKNGQRHRENDLPACIEYKPDGITIERKEWYRNGIEHRDNNCPSYISDKIIRYKQNGKHHRYSGPAIIMMNSFHVLYCNYLHGESLTSYTESTKISMNQFNYRTYHTILMFIKRIKKRMKEKKKKRID